MSRIRLSTTVDPDLLESARRVAGTTDAALVDEALAAFLACHLAVEVDASYAAYDDAVIPRHRRALVAPCTPTIRGLAGEVVLDPW